MPLFDGIQAIDELELEHKRVMIRVDWDIPVEGTADELAAADARLRDSLPTVELALQKGARVLLATHLGSAKPGRSGWPSIEGVGARLAGLVDWDILIPEDCVGDAPKKLVTELRGGQVILLENLRANPGELKCDETFARKLAELADVYVDDAFALAREKAASILMTPRLVRERAAGLALAREARALDALGGAGARPFVAVIGGDSFSAAHNLIEALLPRADAFAFGGAVANTLLAASGVAMRASPYEIDKLPVARTLLGKMRDARTQVLLPTDVVAADSPDRAAGVNVNVRTISEREGALDIGAETARRYAEAVEKAGTVLAVGILGASTSGGFSGGTRAVATALARSTGAAFALGDDWARVLARTAEDPQARAPHVFRAADVARAALEGSRLLGLEALRS